MERLLSYYSKYISYFLILLLIILLVRQYNVNKSYPLNKISKVLHSEIKCDSLFYDDSTGEILQFANRGFFNYIIDGYSYDGKFVQNNVDKEAGEMFIKQPKFKMLVSIYIVELNNDETESVHIDVFYNTLTGNIEPINIEDESDYENIKILLKRWSKEIKECKWDK